VGKNARGNDALTFHHAKGKDIWMHIRDASGAHVIVPARFIKEMKVVEGAAQLAAHFSPLRHDTRVDIRRTERKNLRKPGKGAAPGRVLVSAEENMTITPDPSWVIEILRQEKPA
jgi:predicted ribosome quality control (RQC) complex YloA/Tae2 family protein